MLILGLVGGIASGKSVVANVLRDMGAMVLDADKAGHFVLREPEVIAELRKRWGDGILDPGSQISRRAVAKIVFAQGNEAERKFLEQLTHPRIDALLKQELEAVRTGPQPPPVLVIDAALLFEAVMPLITGFAARSKKYGNPPARCTSTRSSVVLPSRIRIAFPAASFGESCQTAFHPPMSAHPNVAGTTAAWVVRSITAQSIETAFVPAKASASRMKKPRSSRARSSAVITAAALSG